MSLSRKSYYEALSRAKIIGLRPHFKGGKTGPLERVLSHPSGCRSRFRGIAICHFLQLHPVHGVHNVHCRCMPELVDYLLQTLYSKVLQQFPKIAEWYNHGQVFVKADCSCHPPNHKEAYSGLCALIPADLPG